MKQNRSLAISTKLQKIRSANIIGALEKEFPMSVLEGYTNDQKSRERVFTPANTLLTMVLTSVQEDKTLQNSVNLFYFMHQRMHQETLREENQRIEKEKKLHERRVQKVAGRPRKFEVQLPKSLSRDISFNTAAYSKARKRLPLELTQKLFLASRVEKAKNDYTHWRGYRVFIADGTYLQMQDTKEIRKDFAVKHQNGGSGYPQGLLEVIIERGTGQVFSYKLSDRHISELALFYEMLDELPKKSLLLMDDLYNCFEIISKCKRRQIDFIVPAKRERGYQIEKVITEGDEIIRIKTPKNRSKWLKDNEPANTFLIRRIQCKSPEGKEYVLHTSILDESISKEEIQIHYLTRWDIEISIREVKTVMDINVLRSKTPEMALKELTVTLTTYNLLRKIIYASVKDLHFSPKEDFIHEFYTYNKDVLMDKKGRIYNRWSPGRRRAEANHPNANATETESQQEI